MKKNRIFQHPYTKLYVILDVGLLGEKCDIEKIRKIGEEVCEGGADVVQIRAKNISDSKFLEIAQKLHDITKLYDIPLIINDRLDIAYLIDAEGIHLGKEDIPISQAKKMLPDKITGFTCHDIGDVEKASFLMPDYIGIGPVFTSTTKPSLIPLSIDNFKVLVDKAQESKLPVIAIGGINASNILQLTGLNLAGVAVASYILTSCNIKETTLYLKSLLNNLNNPKFPRIQVK